MPNAIPFGPADGFRVCEYFASGLTTSGNIGNSSWLRTTIGNASTLAYLDSTAAAAPGGGLHLTTAATADGDGEAVHGVADTVVLNGNGGFVRFRAQLADQIASNNFRIGLDDSVTATAPTVGIWVNCDGGVLSLEADSADHGDRAANVTGVSTLTSGTTMVVATWHDFLLTWDGTNDQGGPDSAHLWVDGELGASILDVQIDDDEEMEPKIAHWQDSGGALAVELYVAYYDCIVFR